MDILKHLEEGLSYPVTVLIVILEKLYYCGFCLKIKCDFAFLGDEYFSCDFVSRCYCLQNNTN